MVIVLPHIENVYGKQYIKGVRILKPSGIIVFQIPSGRNRLPTEAFKAVIKTNSNTSSVTVKTESKLPWASRLKCEYDHRLLGVVILGNHEYRDHKVFKWNDL